MFNQLLIRIAIIPLVELQPMKKQPQSSPLMLSKEKKNISFGETQTKVQIDESTSGCLTEKGDRFEGMRSGN
jgi:hypothetical protein